MKLPSHIFYDNFKSWLSPLQHLEKLAWNCIKFRASEWKLKSRLGRDESAQQRKLAGASCMVITSFRQMDKSGSMVVSSMDLCQSATGARVKPSWHVPDKWLGDAGCLSRMCFMAICAYQLHAEAGILQLRLGMPPLQLLKLTGEDVITAGQVCALPGAPGPV